MSKLGFDGWVRINKAKQRGGVCGRSSKQENCILGTKKHMRDSKARESMESWFEGSLNVEENSNR